MRDNKRKSKIVNVLCWLGMALITGYFYFSSRYISKFAEIHLTIPKINLPIFAGEIVLFGVIFFAGLIFFLEKEKMGVDSRKFIKKYWFIAAFFVFIIAKAFLGLHRYGFLAFRNAAMFYYPLFAFAAFYFYRRFSFRPFLYYIALIILVFIVCRFPLVCDFIFLYYILMFVFVLKARGWWRIAGFAMIFIVFCFNRYLVDQARAIIVAFGISLIYFVLISTFFINSKVRNYKGFGASILAVVGILFIVYNFVLDRYARDRLFLVFDFSKYIKEYAEISRYVNAGKDTYVPKVMVREFYEKNPESRENIAAIARYSDFLNDNSFIKKSREARLDGRLGDILAKGSDKRIIGEDGEVVKLKDAVRSILKEVDKDISGILFENIDEIRYDDFDAIKKGNLQRASEEEISKKIFSLKEKKVQKAAEKHLRKLEAQGVSKKELKVVEKLVEAETKDFLIRKVEGMAQRVVQEQDYILKTYVLRSETGELNNIMWRIFAWKDMLEEIFRDKRNLLWGMPFGHPFRSRSLEILKWDDGSRVGWIEPHNSYIHVFYRSGVIGIILIIVSFYLFIKMTLFLIYSRDTAGIALASALLFWLILSCFKVVWELPYYAIPFWSLFGVVLKRSKLSKEAANAVNY